MNNWIKSSACNADSPMCVEVVYLPDTKVIALKDTANDVVCYTPDEWGDFIDAVKKGEFDTAVLKKAAEKVDSQLDMKRAERTTGH